MTEILIIRLSAIGDVAMTIPVIYSIARANPSTSFTVLTQVFLKSMFIHPPENVHVITIDIKGSQKTFGGLMGFAAALTKERYDAVIDLHDVIRSRIIDWHFRLRGKCVYVLDKGRKERKMLTRSHNKVFTQLCSVSTRYADVFRSAGFDYKPSFTSLFGNLAEIESIVDDLVGKKTSRWLGIAPFAGHAGKTYPLDKMEQVVGELSKQGDVGIFLFGGRTEATTLKQWETAYKQVRSMANSYSLAQELAIISRLDAMVSMDSANMHLASLAGTPVISIWGATHPYAGFYGFGQSPERAVQVEMCCRPCSVFGEKPCRLHTYECMHRIEPERILSEIRHFFAKMPSVGQARRIPL